MDWQTFLSKAGYRLSEPRKRIMKLMEMAEKPLNPLAIHRLLREQGVHLGLVSVYRTLELFFSLGLISQVFQPDGLVGYLPASFGHHHFIVCQNCHKAVEFLGSEDMRELVQRIQTETHYQVREHLLQFYGLCPECQGLLKEGEKL